MYKYSLVDNKKVFTFVPKLDTVTCTNKENEMLHLLTGDNNNVIFDMTGVEYISSYFLRICTVIAKHIGNSKLKIINATPNVKKVFKIAGFDKILEII